MRPMQKNVKRNHKHLILALLSLVTLKAFLPFGVMPVVDGGSRFTLEICLPSGDVLSAKAKAVQDDLARLIGDAPSQPPHSDMSQDICAFAMHVGQHVISNVQENIFLDRVHIVGYVGVQNEMAVLRNIARDFSVRAPPAIV